MSMIHFGGTPCNWHTRIAKHLQGRARIAKSTPDHGPHERAHIASLEALAQYLLGGIPADDVKTGLFLQLFVMTGRGPNGQTYEPSETANRLLNGLGKRSASGGQTEDPLSVLLELVAAELYDFNKKHQGVVRQVAIAEESAAAAEAKAAEAERANLEASGELDTAHAELANVKEELAGERERSAHFRGRLEALGGEPKTKDRKAVEGHENIYSRVRADGETIYQVGWREDGRQRWHTTGPKLDDAIAFRDEQLAAAAERQKLEAGAAAEQREQVEAAAR